MKNVNIACFQIIVPRKNIFDNAGFDLRRIYVGARDKLPNHLKTKSCSEEKIERVKIEQKEQYTTKVEE